MPNRVLVPGRWLLKQLLRLYLFWFFISRSQESSLGSQLRVSLVCLLLININKNKPLAERGSANVTCECFGLKLLRKV